MGRWKRIGDSLYRRDQGEAIYARVRVGGKETYRGTHTTVPSEARQWLAKWRKEKWCLENGIEAKGISLHRTQFTIGELIDEYVKAGHPTRKMGKKAPRTVEMETCTLRPIRCYFANRPAASLSLRDVDSYHDWCMAGGYVSRYKLRGHERVLRTRGGDRAVDMELNTLGHALHLAVRRNHLTANPLVGRGRYKSEADVRHCRELAPTPDGLDKLVQWLREANQHAIADLVCFWAYSGLRLNEARSLEWTAIDWDRGIINVKREKRGIIPWVPILQEMRELLLDMQKRAIGHLLFPSPFDPNKPRDESAIRHAITRACIKVGIRHVAPHGLRSYFVTQARESGLTDAEIAMLIGDKTGPAIIAQTYGDVRPDHLFRQAQRIVLRATGRSAETTAPVRPEYTQKYT